MKKITLLMVALLLGVTGVKADVEWSIWKGENTDNVYIPKGLVANMEVGDKILVSFEQTDEGQDGELCIGWNTIAYKYMGEGYTNYFDYTNNKVTITITQTLKNQVAGTAEYTKYYWDSEWKSETVTSAGDLRIKANGSLKFESIALQKQKSFIAKSYDVTATIGDWTNGTNVYPSGLTSDDYLYFNATVNTISSNWAAQLGDLGTIAVVGGFWFPVTTYYNTLNTNGAYLNGSYINVTGMKQYHPINSFNIGSIGMATFSADQEVTVPEGLTAYKATVNGDNVSLSKFTNNVIPANQGAIIVGDQGAVVEFEATSTGSTEKSDLQAVTTATDVTSLPSGYDYYVLYNNPTGGNVSLSLDDLNCGWGSSYNSTDKTITFEDAWKGRGWGWNFDYSDYSKVVVEFESAPSAGVLKVQYNEPENYTEESGYSAGATSVEIALNAEKKNSVNQIYLSASAGGTLTLTNAYLVKNSGSATPEFRKTTSGTLAANKAYLQIASGSLARALRVVFEDDITGINNVEVKKPVTINDDVIYNLNGQVVTNPSKGIYIKNGKKFIVK
jgi:hypothetical protein